ncbi:hypothetical protein VRU48_10165 [Pedobacter sp. KR3-3]|uniref:Uncharacterized protein n=1 Tax=Pedobacter albus TaxID=3113905 RepID=A0ABU7I8C0_9SPHI|nr:hypothetical protein [Pedobacter sp. KR3-3]MEE1945474.1 hypothetical protein [Pedobacter sp. KR3-3]
MTIFEKLALYKKEKTCCRIKRLVEKSTHKFTYCYILDYSDDFVLVKEIAEIHPDGFRIIPIIDIVKIRNNKYDKYMDYMLESEGLKEGIKITFKIDLSNWQSIFTSLKENDLNCIIENESDKNFFFSIGPVIEVKKKSLWHIDFDPEGYLDNEPSKIKFKNITSITFDNNYINVFSKYLRNKS